MYCDLWLQYIKVQKLFKGANYSRAETILGNKVSIILKFLFLFDPFYRLGKKSIKKDSFWGELEPRKFDSDII